jgi:hypothetical protein
MYLKFKTIKYAKACKVKIVLFYSVEHEPNLYPDPH